MPALKWIRYRVNRPLRRESAPLPRRAARPRDPPGRRDAGAQRPLPPHAPAGAGAFAARIPRLQRESEPLHAAAGVAAGAIARHIAWRAKNALRWSRARRSQGGLDAARPIRRGDCRGVCAPDLLPQVFAAGFAPRATGPDAAARRRRRHGRDPIAHRQGTAGGATPRHPRTGPGADHRGGQRQHRRHRRVARRHVPTDRGGALPRPALLRARRQPRHRARPLPARLPAQ